MTHLHAALAALFLFSPSAVALPTAAVVDRGVVVQPATNPSASTCYVHVANGDGTGSGGTGTVIASEGGKSLVLTNAHVVENGNQKIIVYHNAKPFTATYVAGHRVTHPGPGQIRVHGPDLALVVINVELPYVAVAKGDPPTGARSRIWGFGGRLWTQGAVEKRGTVYYRPELVEPTLLSVMYTIPGDSGSGVFNDEGELIGVHWGGDGRSASAVPVRVVRKWLRTVVDDRFPRLTAALGEGVPAPVKPLPTAAPPPGSASSPPPPSTSLAPPPAGYRYGYINGRLYLIPCSPFS